jgi:hypothetical protein
VLTDKDCEFPESTLNGALLLRTDVPPNYLAARDADPSQPEAFLEEARRRAGNDDVAGAVRALSSIVEQRPGQSDVLRLVGYRLLALEQPGSAVRLFRQVQRSRPFEAHSYRDLAQSLVAAGRYGLTALQYEVILGGQWHGRFGPALQQVAREEYAGMLREALRRESVSRSLAEHFRSRLREVGGTTESADLRVTISWNTDATDVDLWVIEPSGFKCYYNQTRSPGGGVLSADQTQGYGPERYQIARTGKGTYVVKVHYFRANPNLLVGETHVQVMVTRYAGTPQEVIARHTVILKKANEEVEVCRLEF